MSSKLYFFQRFSFIEHTCSNCGKRVVSLIKLKATGTTSNDNGELTKKERAYEKAINVDKNWLSLNIMVKCPECKKNRPLTGDPLFFSSDNVNALMYRPTGKYLAGFAKELRNSKLKSNIIQALIFVISILAVILYMYLQYQNYR